MFNWDEFRNEKIAVWCDTEEKAREFIKECHSRNLRWGFSRDTTNYDTYKTNTCYVYNFESKEAIEFSNSLFYKRAGFKIIKWESEKMKFKVGDKVRAIDDRYTFTNKENGFIGEVVELIDETSPTGYKDLMVQDLNGSLTYKVNSSHFELVEEPTEFTFQEVIARIKVGETYQSIYYTSNIQEITKNKKGKLLLNLSPCRHIKDEVHIISEIKFKLQEPKKMYVLYEVIHAEKGKEYTFRPKEGYEVVPRDWVVCDTKKGKTFGRVIGSIVKQLTEKEYKQYKECWRA